MWESLLARAMRTAALAAVCVLLAVLGHVLASPTLLPQTVAVQAWCALFAAGYLFTGRERPLPAIVSFVLATQVVLHVWFAATQAPYSTSSRCAAVAGLPPGLTVPGVCGAAVPSWAISPLMLSLHLLCVLLCAWWLRRGEAAYHAVARVVRVLMACTRALLSAGIALLRQIVPLRRPRPPKPIGHDGPTRASLGARLPLVRRGPPLRSRRLFA